MLPFETSLYFHLEVKHLMKILYLKCFSDGQPGTQKLYNTRLRKVVNFC